MPISHNQDSNRKQSKISSAPIEDDSKEILHIEDIEAPLSMSASNSIISQSCGRSDIYTSKHNQGAHIRKHMFNLNEEILNLHIRGREESREHIQDPTLIGSQNLIGLEFPQNEVVQSFDSPEDYNKQHSTQKNSFRNTITVSDMLSKDPRPDNLQGLKEDKRNGGRISTLFESGSGQNASGPMQTGQTGLDPMKQVRSPTLPKIELNEQLSMSPQGRKMTTRGPRRDLTLISKNRAYSTATESVAEPRGSLNDFLKNIKQSYLINRFTSKIKSFSQKYNFKQLSKFHYDIIGDKASTYLQSEHFHAHDENNARLPACLGFLQRLLSSSIDILKSVQTTNPESRISVICDIVYGLALLLYLYVIPMEVSFQVSFDTLEIVVFIIFGLNLILTFNKCYYYKGRMISDRISVLKNFMSTQFIVDLIVFIFWRLNFFKFIVYIKIVDINRIIKRADDHFEIVRKSPIIFSLTNLIVKMTLIAQLAGCMFHYVARYETEQGVTLTWIDKQGMTNDTWENRYVISIYFAFITMMTVGYGDVTPVNNYERIYVIFMTFLSSGIFGYVVNTIGELYLQQAKKQEEFQKRKQEISLYLDQREIETSSKQKILNYLEYSFQFRKKKDMNADSLFKDIPQNLVEEVYTNYYGRYLKLNKIMRINFSEKFLTRLSLCMKEKNLAPGEELYDKGSKGSRVYFLASGKVDFILGIGQDNQPSRTIEIIGTAIGLRSSLIEKDRPTGVKCQEDQSCSLIYFEMDDFKKILYKYPKDYERFCELRDDILLNSNTLDIKCDSCDKYDHTSANCPLVTLNFQHSQFIARYLNSGEPNVREVCQRSNFKYKSISKNAVTKAKLRQYRMSLVFMIIPEMREATANFKDHSDKYFFKKMPTVKIMDGGDMEAEMEEYNIYEAYDTMAAGDDQNREDEDTYTSEMPEQTDEPIRSSIHAAMNDISGENNLGSSSYSSSQHLSAQQQAYQSLTQVNIAPPTALHPIQANQVVTLSTGAKESTQQSIFGGGGHQKMSLFANKQSLTVEITPSANDTQSQINLNTSNIQQGSSRNLSFRRERGDSFMGQMRNQLQYSQQRSLQSRVKSSRKLSGTHQHSAGKNSFQVSFQASPQNEPAEPVQLVNPNQELFFYDFEKMKLFEKYFPNQNYTNVIKRFNFSRRFINHNSITLKSPNKRKHKTLLLSPKRRKSGKNPSQINS